MSRGCEIAQTAWGQNEEIAICYTCSLPHYQELHSQLVLVLWYSLDNGGAVLQLLLHPM